MNGYTATNNLELSSDFEFINTFWYRQGLSLISFSFLFFYYFILLFYYYIFFYFKKKYTLQSAIGKDVFSLRQNYK